MTVSTGATLDPRLNAYREDLAGESLRGVVEAERFASGEIRQVRAMVAPVRKEPDAYSELQTEALHGEIVTVYDERNGWSWGQLSRDGYVGYLPTGALGKDVTEPSHRVSALATFIYGRPDFKSAPIATLSLNARISATPENERFLRLTTGGYVIARHVGEIDRVQRDWVDVAERFQGTPYLWGGRTRFGIDCSGLVQVALEAAGISCPRDSDMQRAALGEDMLVPEDLEGLERGDIVCWPGHVGIVVDPFTLVHANAHHMSVVVEPLLSAVERNAREGVSVVAVKRIERGRKRG